MSYEAANGYRIRNQYGTHFLTFSVVGMIDIFSRQRYRDILINALQFCREKKGLLLGGYVIMTNHVHCIWTGKDGNLSGIIRDFKSFTSKTIIDSVINEPESRRDWLLHMFAFHAKRTNANEYYKVWTNDNHPEEIFGEKFCKIKLAYIHDNPVRAGFVREAEFYLYSSAINYAGGKGLIDIDFLF